MRYCAVVILYYPGESLHSNLLSYLPFVEKLYVYDNSETSQYDKLTTDLLRSGKIEYHHDGVNGGIALRLNQACSRAIKEGYDAILTMDQDSCFQSGDVQQYFRQIESFVLPETVGMFGVKYALQNEETASADIYKEVKHLITSGSVINLKLFESIGTFDEKLFIDGVDFEFCLRVILSGKKVVEFQNIHLRHSLGTSQLHTSLKSFKKTSRSLHSPIRLYYMLRNYLYLAPRYRQQFPAEIAHLKNDILNRIKNNFLYGNARRKLVFYLLKGVKDALSKKMGKIAS